MNRTRASLRSLIGIAALTLSTLAAAGDVYVIGHSDVNIAAGDVRDVYLGEKQHVGGVKLVPVDNASLQGQFLEKALKMDSAKYTSQWTKKAFRDGANPPPVKGSDAEVISFVKATAGAVGYVGSPPGADVKSIAKF